MTFDERLAGISQLFLDTAPVIYYVEEDPRYLQLVEQVFNRLDGGTLRAVTSPITLAECLVMPYRIGRPDLRDIFIELLTDGPGVLSADIDDTVAVTAAELRGRYNVTLTDALQIATALRAGCNALLTNDNGLRRVIELDILILDDFMISP